MSVDHEEFEDLLEILVTDGVLSAASAGAVRSRLRDSWVPLGKVLRQLGNLSMTQLLDVLDERGEHPDKRLGQICIERGYCTFDEVLAALRVQRQVCPHAIDVVLHEGECDPANLCRSIARYVRELEARLAAGGIRG